VHRHDPKSQCGKRIRILRNRQGLTLEEVGKKASLVRGSLSRIENGKMNTRLETLARIATALGVPLASFFQDDDGTPLFDTGLPREVLLLRDILAMFQGAYVPMLGVN
jgi:transcriptional regulator with XRE-family HTH domain